MGRNSKGQAGPEGQLVPRSRSRVAERRGRVTVVRVRLVRNGRSFGGTDCERSWNTKSVSSGGSRLRSASIKALATSRHRSGSAARCRRNALGIDSTRCSVGTSGVTPSTRWAASSAIRRPPHDGQNPCDLLGAFSCKRRWFRATGEGRRPWSNPGQSALAYSRSPRALDAGLDGSRSPYEDRGADEPVMDNFLRSYAECSGPCSALSEPHAGRRVVAPAGVAALDRIGRRARAHTAKVHGV